MLRDDGTLWLNVGDSYARSGGLACAAAMLALIVVPLSALDLTGLLAVAGLGLGTFVPANNTVIMAASPGATAGVLGGLVNMARGVGTALGISVVTLALHLAPRVSIVPGRPAGPDPRPALAMLALTALAAAFTALAGRAGTPTGPGTGAGEERPGAFG